ncbi:MAG: SPOR domain-containing protein [Gammaproteobacteria bacterium]
MSPRDYKPAPARRKKAAGAAPGSWMSFLSGLALGLLVAFGVYLWAGRLPAPDTSPPSAYRDGETRGEAHRAPPAAAELPRPTFDFYKILPEMEVPIPNWEQAQTDQPGPPGAPSAGDDATPAATPDATLDRGTYLLQVGSFQRFEDADRVKATLALRGITASIQRVVINGQDVWFRVHVGPLSSEEEIRAMRVKLIENDMDFILLRIGEAGAAQR